MSRPSLLILILSALFVASLSLLVRGYLPSDVEITSSPPRKPFDEVKYHEQVESKVSLSQSLSPSKKVISPNKVTLFKTALKPSTSGLSLGMKVVRKPSLSYKLFNPEFKPLRKLEVSSYGPARSKASDQTKSAIGDHCWTNICKGGERNSVLIGGLLVNQKPSSTSASTLRLGFWERFKPMFFLSIW